MLSAHIELILLITGLATAGAVVLFVAPVTMLKMLFGQAPADALSLLIARHWGLLVFLVGALLVYAAYHPETRVPTLVVAIAEKAAFAIGIFISPFRRRRAVLVMALADLAWRQCIRCIWPAIRAVPAEKPRVARQAPQWRLEAASGETVSPRVLATALETAAETKGEDQRTALGRPGSCDPTSWRCQAWPEHLEAELADVEKVQ